MQDHSLLDAETFVLLYTKILFLLFNEFSYVHWSLQR